MAGPVVVVSPEGHFGRALVDALVERKRAPIVLVENPSAALETFPDASRALRFNGLTGGAWSEAFDGADVVLNLAGLFPAPDRDRREHAQRRRMGGRLVAEAFDAVRVRPRLLITVSSVGSIIEGQRPGPSVPLDESTPVSNRPSKRDLRDLELSAMSVRGPDTRSVILRLGAVLDGREGLLAAYRRRFELHLGGPVLPRMGLWPWIHRDDALAMLLFAAFEAPELQGPLHAVAPAPATSAQLAVETGLRLHRIPWLPIPRRVARRSLGDELVELLTRGPPISSRAESLGFKFRHPNLESALNALLGKPRLREHREHLEVRS